MIFSMASVSTGRFSSARDRPFCSFFSLNGSRRPSDLMTWGRRSSARSKVVNRSLQTSHSRRRRTEESISRDSNTFVSLEQYGHNIHLHLFYSFLFSSFCFFFPKCFLSCHLASFLLKIFSCKKKAS